jgi:hypothetical protein
MACMLSHRQHTGNGGHRRALPTAQKVTARFLAEKSLISVASMNSE